MTPVGMGAFGLLPAKAIAAADNAAGAAASNTSTSGVMNDVERLTVPLLLL